MGAAVESSRLDLDVMDLRPIGLQAEYDQSNLRSVVTSEESLVELSKWKQWILFLRRVRH